MREKNPESHRQRVSASLVGKFGERSRRWKGNNATYAAIHMWVKKHWGMPDHCDFCHCEQASRFEWCNKDKQYRRVREDWIQLCPSCHGRFDHALLREKLYGDKCKNGHLMSENLAVNNRGHRYCRACSRESQRRYGNAKVFKV